MGTGAFDVTLDIDMLNDTIADYHLPVQDLLAAYTVSSMTPGRAVMTLYDTNSPTWSERHPQQKQGGCIIDILPDITCTQSHVSPFGMSHYRTSPFYDRSRGAASSMTSLFYDGSRGAASSTYSLTSPTLNLMSPRYPPSVAFHSVLIVLLIIPLPVPSLPQLVHYLPLCTPCTNVTLISKILAHVAGATYISTSTALTSPTYSPASAPVPPVYSPTSPQWSPSSPAQMAQLTMALI
ncbi:hypothetical protein BKA82DRAFT_4018097 [Pisolithus tinctorius]|nr:hypothetical protein BKA82DRAFT_4018097 [Pisolithus tinctorius]